MPRFSTALQRTATYSEFDTAKTYDSNLHVNLLMYMLQV